MQLSFINVDGHILFLTRFCTLSFTFEITASVGDFNISDKETIYMKLFIKSFHRLTTHQPKRHLETIVSHRSSLASQK